jgi:hypothetical protein
LHSEAFPNYTYKPIPGERSRSSSKSRSTTAHSSAPTEVGDDDYIQPQSRRTRSSSVGRYHSQTPLRHDVLVHGDKFPVENTMPTLQSHRRIHSRPESYYNSQPSWAYQPELIYYNTNPVLGHGRMPLSYYQQVQPAQSPYDFGDVDAGLNYIDPRLSYMDTGIGFGVASLGQQDSRRAQLFQTISPEPTAVIPKVEEFAREASCFEGDDTDWLREWTTESLDATDMMDLGIE